jgi:hypothetical protein
MGDHDSYSDSSAGSVTPLRGRFTFMDVDFRAAGGRCTFTALNIA